MNDVSCKFLSWLRLVSEDLTYWLLAWMTLNRIAAITWITKFHWVTSIQTTCVALAIIILYSSCVNVHCFWVFKIRRKSTSKLADNASIPSCSTYLSTTSKEYGNMIMVMMGYIEPLLPLSILFILSMFLSIRLILIATKHRKLRKLNSEYKKGSVKIDIIRSTPPNNTVTLSGEEFQPLTRERSRNRKEVQLALVIITFALAELLVDGTINIQAAYVALASSRTSDPSIDTRPQSIRQINSILRDTSIILRIWNFWAYLIIMPNFRHSFLDFIRRIKCTYKFSSNLT